MSYSENLLHEKEKQLELAKKGFCVVLKEVAYSDDIDQCEKLLPYIKAVEEIKTEVEYYRQEVEKEKAKDNA